MGVLRRLKKQADKKANQEQEKNISQLEEDENEEIKRKQKEIIDYYRRKSSEALGKKRYDELKTAKDEFLKKLGDIS